MKKQFLILGGAIVGIIALFFLIDSGSQGTGSLFEAEGNVVETGEPTSSSEDWISQEEVPNLRGTIFVDVQGEVHQPGVIEASADARVGDVIAAAGGLTPDAHTRGLNQAARIYDEMVVFVPHRDDIQEMAVNPGELPPEVGNPPSSSGLISISRASQGELQTLPGIGPALSSAIVEYREANGGFNSIDELTNVPGIGAGRLDSIRDLIEP